MIWFNLLALVSLILCSSLADAKPAPGFLEIKRHDGPGYMRASSDEDMQPLYDANLSPDMAYWKERQHGRPFVMLDLATLAWKAISSSFVGILIVKAGQVHVYADFASEDFAFKRMTSMQGALMRLIANGSRVPNTIMIFNAEDEPLCDRIKGGCKVPIFTCFKRCLRQTGPASIPPSTAKEAAPCQDKELLVPNFSQNWDTLRFFPWATKKNMALMRGSFQRTMDQNSTRYLLAEMSARNKEAAGILDAGLVFNRNHKVLLPDDLKRDFMGMSNASRYRFLLSTDGHTASSRLGHLLGVNSVVLKEASPWIEYYYRSLREGEDHYEFEVQSVLSQLRDLMSPQRSADLQKVVGAAQRFTYRYLHEGAKALYVRQTIIQYNRLFEGMEKFVEDLSLTSSVFTARRVSELIIDKCRVITV